MVLIIALNATFMQKVKLYNYCEYFLINLNICFGCSKEPSQYGSVEFPQHMFGEK